MYKDKRIGLIASFLLATFWVHLFNTMRFHIGIMGLFIGLLAIYVFFQGYENKEKIFGKINPNWAIPLAATLSILTYTIRRGYFLFGLFFLVYVFSTRKLTELIKDKYNWIGLALAIILFYSAEKIIFISKITGVGQAYFHEEFPLTLSSLGVFPAYFNNLITPWLSVLLYLFWIGVAILVINVFFSFDYLRKKGKSSVKSDYFNIIMIILTMAFFIFILRNQNGIGEARWYFPLILGAFVAISKASLIIYEQIKPYSKEFAIAVMIILITLGGYYEVKHADSIILGKVNSFEGIKQAGLFLGEISSPTDVIITVPKPQLTYYSERKVESPAFELLENIKESDVTFEEFLTRLQRAENNNTKYLIVSFSEPTRPEWLNRVYVRDNQIVAWEIPFMNTTIDFVNSIQDIKQSMTYDNITFNLINIKEDIFIYKIIRN